MLIRAEHSVIVCFFCVFSGSDQVASFGGTVFRYYVPSAALFFVFRGVL